MGVMATYCQICGVPVQQDHYVPIDNMFGIYRGGDGYEVCDPAVGFGPEHAWLKQAIGLRLHDDQMPVVIEGEVHDGGFDTDDDDGLVFEGLEERAALHKACWELAGKPETFEALHRIQPPGWLEDYKEQLFDFAKLLAAGEGWVLADPRGDSPEGRRNRDRIIEALRERERR